MMDDTRSRNKYYKSLRDYASAIHESLNQIDPEELDRALDLLKLTSARSGRIFVAGNGGSAAISDHLCCDFVKGTYTDKIDALQVHSLTGSFSLFSAVANDIGYDKVFGQQLEYYKLTAKDLVILISSSGSSKNIRDALTTAYAYGADVLGLSGFDGGHLKKYATVSIHIPCHNYGVVEDCHQAVMHFLAQSYYLETNGQS